MRKALVFVLMSAENGNKVSRYAVAGAVVFPFGFLSLALFFPAAVPLWLQSLLIALGGIAIITAVILGILSIRQIRRSAGDTYGMRLAVFLSLFYPIIVLDLLLFMLGWSILGTITTSSLVPLAWLVVIILVDYLVVRITWNRAIG